MTIPPEKKRAARNRTLSLSADEYAACANRLLHLDPDRPVAPDMILDQTLHHNLFEILDRLPAAFADLIILDPPYNLTKTYNDYTFQSSSDERYAAYLRSWLPAVVRCLKPEGSLYLCGDWRSASVLQTVLGEHLTIMNRITWQREKGRGAQHNWKNSMEDIWFAVKDRDHYYFDVDAVKLKRKVLAPYRENGRPKDWESTPEGNFRMTFPSNFWDDVTVPYWSMPENTDHPTQKPEKLMAKLILASCPAGGCVFDPFLGSGTSAVVAKKLGRHYCGVEMDFTYACWAEARILRAGENPRIQGYSEGVFWVRNQGG
jgi:site-specific DNA-methyltransferase (adenine-specific)